MQPPSPYLLSNSDSGKSIVEYLLNFPGMRTNVLSYSLAIVNAAESGNKEALLYLLNKMVIFLKDNSEINFENPLMRLSTIGLTIENILESALNDALSSAAENGHTDIVRILINEGAELNIRDKLDNTPLIKAAIGGYDNTIRELINEGAEVNVENVSGITPLTYAAIGGHDETLKTLIEKGAEVNRENNQGATSIIHAAKYGQTGAIQILIDKGADVKNIADKRGNTPLMAATQNEHIDAISLLVNAGAGMNRADNQGNTALMIAIIEGKEDVAKSLLEYGKIELDSTNKEGKNTLMLAIQNKMDHVSLLLIKRGIDVSKTDEDNNTALLLAILNDRMDIAEILLKTPDANINAINKEGKTALIATAEKNDLDFVKLLLQSPHMDLDAYRQLESILWKSEVGGDESIIELILELRPDVDAKKDKWPSVALISAVEKGVSIDIIERLLTIPGIDVDIRNYLERTPLMIAAGQGMHEIVASLLDKDADLNREDRFGNTPLISALLGAKKKDMPDQNLQKTVELLVNQEGTKVNASNTYGMNALTLATEELEDMSIVKILLEHPDIEIDENNNEFKKTPLMKAATGAHYELIALLLESGADANIEDAQGKIALAMLLDYGADLSVEHTKYYFKTMKLLIEHTADVNVMDKLERPGIYVAARNNRPDVVLSFIEAGANVDARRVGRKDGGDTALITAATHGYLSVVTELLDAGARGVNAMDKNGNTALIYAARNGHTDIVKKLINKGANSNILNGLKRYKVKKEIIKIIKKTNSPFRKFRRKASSK